MKLIPAIRSQRPTAFPVETVAFDTGTPCRGHLEHVCYFKVFFDFFMSCLLHSSAEFALHRKRFERYRWTTFQFYLTFVPRGHLWFSLGATASQFIENISAGASSSTIHLRIEEI